MTRKTVSGAVRKLVARHGAKRRADIQRGVEACARVWEWKEHGEAAFGSFCLEQYVPPGKQREALLRRLDEFHRSVVGNLGETRKVASAGQDMADRPLLAAEKVLASYAPGIHLSEDYRRFNVAAVVQLNFGGDDLTPPRTRSGWAARRVGDIGRERIPAPLLARHAVSSSEVDRFVSAYNLHLDRFDFGDRRVRFPRGTKLISHWGLRDYMLSLQGKPDALPRQRAILDLMRRVVDGDIPAEVLDDESVRWDIPGRRITRGGKTTRAIGHGSLRWEKFRQVWRDQLKIDPHTRHGNVIDNKFLVEREIPEDEVVKILTDIVSSPLAERVARYVRDRLGRDLEPFDVYYRGFLDGTVEKEPLGYDIRKRYPDADALRAAIPGILTRLGWSEDRARWIGQRIRVDNARSAGHAWSPYTTHDRQLLRVRVDRNGCDELSFDTFMHELGHCVEGVLSSFEMDWNVLWSVPNTAFTEGFAFTFQDRTDEILGRPPRPSPEALPLVRFWEPFEIAGPALTEIRFFHWLYGHRNASADQMMKAVRRIGDEVWQEYYARIFGADGHGLMSVYSHMLWCDFYLADYPMGYVIAYQVRKHLAGKSLPDEMERMCAVGSVYPQEWMKKAVGRGISVKPLLEDTRKALDGLGY